MAIIAAPDMNIQLCTKAIPTLDNNTDTMQVGGTVDGVFHGADADANNVKPIMIGQGVAAQSVSVVIASDQVLEFSSTRIVYGTVEDGVDNEYQVKTAFVDFEPPSDADPADNIIVAAVDGRRIVVLDFSVSLKESLTWAFYDNVGEDNHKISNTFYKTALQQVFQEKSAPGVPLFSTAISGALCFSATQDGDHSLDCSVRVSYIEV